MSRRFGFRCTLLGLTTLLLIGCGPRVGSGSVAANASADAELVVDLPALYIDVDAAGNLSVAGTPLAELGALAGQNLADLNVDPTWVSFLTASNIQHIQLNNTPEGIVILANGEPVPSLGWDGEALVAAVETLEMLGAQINPVMGKLLPLVSNLGVGVVIRLPVTEGAAPIPLEVQGGESAAAMAARARTAFLAAVGNAPQIRATLAYAPDGTFSIAGLTGAELAALGIPLQAFTLPGATVQQISSQGIQSIGLSTNPQGIFISINGRALPHITWDNGEVNHVIRLAGQMGLLTQLFGAGQSTETLVRTIESLLPIVQASDVNLTLTFP